MSKYKVGDIVLVKDNHDNWSSSPSLKKRGKLFILPITIIEKNNGGYIYWGANHPIGWWEKEIVGKHCETIESLNKQALIERYEQV